MMIGHANRQLQKMTDRYLLIRDDAQPLELNVVDNYQAGKIRSTKNLSGGESFIVSPSLALGLSHMASKNVRVDSLFLDEGFGTLDEEALDTSLDAGMPKDLLLRLMVANSISVKDRYLLLNGLQPVWQPSTRGFKRAVRDVLSGITDQAVAARMYQRLRQRFRYVKAIQDRRLYAEIRLARLLGTQ